LATINEPEAQPALGVRAVIQPSSELLAARGNRFGDARTDVEANHLVFLVENERLAQPVDQPDREARWQRRRPGREQSSPIQASRVDQVIQYVHRDNRRRAAAVAR
jgi:hypothetical protein